MGIENIEDLFNGIHKFYEDLSEIKFRKTEDDNLIPYYNKENVKKLQNIGQIFKELLNDDIFKSEKQKIESEQLNVSKDNFIKQIIKSLKKFGKNEVFIVGISKIHEKILIDAKKELEEKSRELYQQENTKLTGERDKYQENYQEKEMNLKKLEAQLEKMNQKFNNSEEERKKLKELSEQQDKRIK